MATIQLGNTTIVVQNELFEKAYEAGRIAFKRNYEGHTLTDRIIFDFIARNTVDRLNMPVANAGYIVGWVAALLDTNTATTEQLAIAIGVLEG